MLEILLPGDAHCHVPRVRLHNFSAAPIQQMLSLGDIWFELQGFLGIQLLLMECVATFPELGLPLCLTLLNFNLHA